MESLEKNRAKTISEIIDAGFAAAAQEMVTTIENAAQPKVLSQAEQPPSEAAARLFEQIRETVSAKQPATAVRIAPDRWLVAIVMDESTKANLEILCRRAGSDPSRRIAQLINQAAAARRRHK